LLSLTISFGLSCYLKHKITECRGVPRKSGTPLLFYPLWTTAKFLTWQVEELHEDRIHAEECHPAPVRLLLAEGADPNECCHGLTPWSIVLRQFCAGLFDFPHHRANSQDVVNRSRLKKYRSEKVSRKSFRDALEIVRLMLEHGADLFLCMHGPDLTISPEIFAELLKRECCSGNAFRDCVCAYATQIKPRLTELVELVEVRRYFKQQMRTDGELILIGAWLVAVLAYILQNVLTLSF
jgi:hypothetical protein